jgi:hypothetical protein
MGVGYQMKSGLGAGIRYNPGISSISENNNYNTRFNILRIGASWTFGPGKK